MAAANNNWRLKCGVMRKFNRALRSLMYFGIPVLFRKIACHTMHGMAQKAYKFRFYPTAAQRRQLAVDFGVARWCWNMALDTRSFCWRALGRSVSGVDLSRAFTELKRDPEYAWLKDANSGVITQKLRDLDRAFANFFAGRTKYPQFKKKSHTQQVRYQLDQRQITRTYSAGELLKLPKIGALKVRWSRLPVGIPKMVTVTKDSNDRYFVSFSVEETIEPLPQRTNAVGIDLGIRDVFVTSDGEKSGNPRYLGRLLRKKRILGRRLSRKRKGSGRWHVMRRKLARLDAHIAACRADFLHKATTELVRQHQVIAIEDLHVRGMLANRQIARSVSDVGMGEFRRQLEYKAAWYGRELIVIDRWFPSSKTCSACGFVYRELKRGAERWACSSCGREHDRDGNAAVNILKVATAGRAGLEYGRGAGHTPSATAQAVA